MAKIVTLGEIMLRLSPMGNDRFIQSESFRIIPGGGEANHAVLPHPRKFRNGGGVAEEIHRATAL